MKWNGNANSHNFNYWIIATIKAGQTLIYIYKTYADKKTAYLEIKSLI